MEEYINIGKIDIYLFKDISNEIITDEVILTPDRYEHIIEKHKEDYSLYFEKVKDILNKPDYILKDSKNKDTAMVIKHIENTNINIILKLAVKNDKKHNKNSIMTFYRIRDKNLKKLIEKNKSIYKNE